MSYQAAANRYDDMPYRRCGKSGLLLPPISLGLWHNFGGIDDFENCKKILLRAFDLGITHFDLANNYGPPPGSAEVNFGKILKTDLMPYRDELIISTKAGYHMWLGPYGEWGSKKYLTASLDQSLKRMGLDYVDIFYSHRFDPNTPLEETMSALAAAQKAGKAIYVGISNYSPQATKEACALLRSMGSRCLIHQPPYNMFNRGPEDGLLAALESEHIGAIVFSPLAQGLLTDRYAQGIPPDSRAARPEGFLKETEVLRRDAMVRKLREIAKQRGQSLSQMAIAWVLRNPIVCSALIGASNTTQLEENLLALKNCDFEKSELEKIDAVLR